MKRKVTVKVIVKRWLKSHGYSGLCGEDCGCPIDDLFICGSEGCTDCTPGYKVIMTKRMKAQINKSDNYSDGMYECEVGEWYISGVKPRRKK